MARMIPPQISLDCRSPGERILFDRFKDDPSTRNWVVLHSLGVTRHFTMIEGEIDFVVIVPGEGVLCLEVKAGNVRRREGIWYYGSEPFQTSSIKGPFKQASEAMHAIREYIKRSDPSLRKILFFSGVLFTYVYFDDVSPEWHPWQYADRGVLSRLPVSTCCLNILCKAHEHIRNLPAGKTWYDPVQSRPTEDQVKRLVNILRSDFEYVVSGRATLEETEKEIQRFTEEQFSALDVLEENDRIIFKGPAGTGKTFLAVEAARRSLLAGKSTLLLCYNKLLGQWLTDQTRTFPQKSPGLFKAGTLHNFLLQLSGLRAIEAADSSFWTRKVPEAVIDRALLGAVRAPFCDMLIIDEAQDLITEEYLDVLDLLLEGGLAGGKWAIFGDFERQSIYIRQELNGNLNIPAMINQRVPVHFNFPLRINCRNTEPIAVGVELICGLRPRYSRILQGQGPDIDIDFYDSQEEQVERLRSILETLKDCFRPSEIVVLSNREDKSSCAGILQPRDPSSSLRPLRTKGGEGRAVGYSTIQAFKGLESPAVILTDIDRITGERAEALLYIGISRARLRLFMLMHERCRDHYVRAVQEGFLGTT